MDDLIKEFQTRLVDQFVEDRSQWGGDKDKELEAAQWFALLTEQIGQLGKAIHFAPHQTMRQLFHCNSLLLSMYISLRKGDSRPDLARLGKP